MVECPTHKPAAKGDDVARHLRGMPFASEDRDEDPLHVIGAVDRQVVVGHHGAQPVRDQLEDAGLVECREQLLVDLQETAL